MSNKVIVNASPIISLSKINKLNLLWELFDEIYVPNAVVNEIILNDGNKNDGEGELKTAIKDNYIEIYNVKDNDMVNKLYGKLHKGELEVIIGGKEINADYVVIDEINARNLAKVFSLVPIGTIGVLRLAKRTKLIDNISDDLKYLTKNGFRISDKLLFDILKSENELL